jgi:peroxiredoxin
MIKPGDKLPTFKLLDHEGATVTNKDLLRKQTLIFAFPRAATPG